MTAHLTAHLLTAALLTGLSATAAMPPAEQNKLVQQYCAICHTDASMNGGISLQHFDAAHANPGDAAMMLSKLHSGALGAAGIKPPEKPVQDALEAAFAAEAAGADRWIIRHNPGAPLTASIVRSVPSTKNDGGEPDLYRLTLSCRDGKQDASMLLTWSPGVPGPGRVFTAAADNKPPASYKIDVMETYGNGMAGSSGPGSIFLSATPLPAQTLTVANLFDNSKVDFPMRDIPAKDRQALSRCFAASTAGSH